MAIKTIIGGQWGDEGKGKVSDLIIAEAVRDCPAGTSVIVVRFNGGPNAGHTIKVGDRKYVVHNLASGIIHAGVINVSGPLVVHDLEAVNQELDTAEECGGLVVFDRSAPVILPLHKQLDKAVELAASANNRAIGTTGRGIGPAYSDFWSRDALKLGDLVNPERIRRALLNRGYYESRAAIVSHFGLQPISLDDTVDWCHAHSGRVVSRLGDTREIVAEAHAKGWTIVPEGAQGILLDTVHGSAPFVTSSFCTAAALTATFGLYDLQETPNEVIAIVKAYTTRVGEGPFPTEMLGTDQAIGEDVRNRGQEFGATTGRPRRCGWLDLVALRYACRVGGITQLAITKLDILSGLPEIKVCIGYEFEGRPIREHETLTGRVLREATPQYVTLPGWSDDISGVRRRLDLPINAQAYLEFIEDFLDNTIPIDFVGVGPERDAIILP
jgi:adenylosuccinate synthase